jgi:hypothetical protein
MLEKFINNHLDTLETIEESAEKMIDKAIGTINIDALIVNPEVELAAVTQIIYDWILDKYTEQAVEEGLSFAKEIEKHKIIKIDDSNDPNLNKE